ncbi:RNA-directed DNA polymerase, eukaryota [Tanacetum coccineum]
MEKDQLNDGLEDGQSEDPFNLYNLLNKKHPIVHDIPQSVDEPKYPPGFTPQDTSEVNTQQELNSIGPSVGNSGGVLCVWDSNMFRKGHATMSDYFIAIMGKWVPNDKNLLIISVYAPQELSEKKMLWQYLNHMIDRLNGEVIVIGDFNEVRSQEERFGSIFNVQGAVAFNTFISSGGLVEFPTGGYSFTWSHKSASKMSKLDRFLISENLFSSCPNISAIILDRYLSDHRPILLRESSLDYGPTLFCFYHYWFQIDGFDSFVAETWRDITYKNDKSKNLKKGQKKKLAEIDSTLDKGEVDADNLEERSDRLILDMEFPNKLSIEQKTDLERPFTKEEIKGAVWDYGLNKSPGPDGFTFGFYQRYWNLLAHDIVEAVNHFFTHGFCSKGCNSSFIALIPKTHDSKLVKDFRPISLIGSLYKIITNILANRFVIVMGNLVNEVQSAFIENRQILDGLRINLHKSKIMGIAVENSKVDFAAANIGCMTLKSPLSYLGVKVGGRMKCTNS